MKTRMSLKLENFPSRNELSLIALDLDGTLLCPHGTTPVSKRCMSAVSRLQDQGTPVTFVTGRTEDYAQRYAELFGIVTPMVTYNGGRIVCPETQAILYQAAIERENIPALLEWLDQRSEVVAAYLSTTDGLKLIQNRCSGNPVQDDHLFGTPRHLVENFRDAWSEIPMGGFLGLSKVIVLTEQPLERQLRRQFESELQVVRTHPALFEILPAGVSKGSGILRLCLELGFDPKTVLAIGDQENDISTFENVGHSVAMGDAPSAVRDAATWVTQSFLEDGCAHVLEILAGLRPL